MPIDTSSDGVMVIVVEVVHTQVLVLSAPIAMLNNRLHVNPGDAPRVLIAWSVLLSKAILTTRPSDEKVADCSLGGGIRGGDVG